MQIRFVTPDLKQIDALRCDALALPWFCDERPLRGALGLIDWRLCGFISKLVIDGAFAGAPLETVLIPGRPKFALSKLFVVGLGSRAEFDDRCFARASQHMLKTMQQAGARTLALVLPGRPTDAIAPTAAMELLAVIAARHIDHEEIVLLEPGEAQRDMQLVVERERRRARATSDNEGS
jgi:hypothetical protein